jgi:HKD family nuclease
MKVDILNQMYGRNDFAHQVKSYLAKGHAGWRLRVLVAFVKRSGLGLLEPELTKFHDNNGQSQWIVGIDCGGTSPEALEYLLGLSKAYPKQINAKIFSAGSPFHVFHPKIYFLDFNNSLVALLGSANVTAGGMFLNCECATKLVIDKTSDTREAKLLDRVWDSYASPSRFLHDLTPQIISKVSDRYGPEQSEEAWEPPQHPFGDRVPSGLPKPPRFPRLTTSFRPSSQPIICPKGDELIMEVLHETRDTQMQIPVEALQKYFGIRQGERAVIALRHKEGNQTKSVKYRSVIYPTSHVRLEMETISGLKRPLIAVFQRDPLRQDTYEYKLLRNGTKPYVQMRKLLIRKGKRTSKTSRRYLMR